MKTNTKIMISILIFFTLIAGLVSPVMADDETSSDVSMQIETDTQELSAGEEIILKININQNERGILALQGTLNLDTSIFELVDKQVTKDEWFLSAYNEDNNMFMIEVSDEAFYDTNAYVYDTETILEVKLKVKDDVQELKDVNVEVNDIIVVDQNFETIELGSISKTFASSSISTATIVGVVIAIIVIVAVVVAIVVIVLKKKKK